LLCVGKLASVRGSPAGMAFIGTSQIGKP
jgi:hypothetical protein